MIIGGGVCDGYVEHDVHLAGECRWHSWMKGVRYGRKKDNAGQ